MNPKKVYIKNHTGGAGVWIYKGYQRAWESLGYETIFYSSLEEINSEKDSYYLMGLDSDVDTQSSLDKVKNSYKAFLYAAPNSFPFPWGSHPNFKCACSPEFIEELNKLVNVILWSFGHTSEYHPKWKKLWTVPLAFDSLSYEKCETSNPSPDVYFVGGWADNGFDEKRKILIDTFNEFEGTELFCALFVNKSLTHQQETELMYNSKVALNVHDAYQRILGTDVNERTFKTLGSTGILVSDDVKCLDEFNFVIARENDPKKYVEAVEKYVFDTEEKELLKIKEHNINEILTKHTYISRVNSLLEM
tara:strand:- start:45 stop:959 length:915 start_codon:yes stop_codon:yes gene_type:complete